jgi:1-acyl-sn-glycerol-3-phosphate acyltransferase
VHRVAKVITSTIVYTMYRSAEVRRNDADLSQRPVIIVANHSAGFPDPVIIMYGTDRMPRFLAKATLWKNAAVGKVFDIAGVIPVNRADDGDTAGNTNAFAACFDVLRDRHVIAIFPEGQIHQGATIADIHTGAARIALGARASGASDIAIVPVGLHYEEKRGRRGRIYANVGDPIDLDVEIDAYVMHGEDESDANHDAVTRLTDDIDARLREVAPDYASTDEWRVLSAAAEVTLRSQQYDPGVPVSFGDREELSQALQKATPAARTGVLDAAATYRDILATDRIRDINVATHVMLGGTLSAYTVRSFGAAIALLPTAAVGLAANIAPMAAVRAMSNGLRVNQLLKSTIQTLASPIVYAGAWTALGAVLRRRGVRHGGTVAWLSGAIGGWALVLASERGDAVRDGLSGWIRLGAEGPSDEARSARQTLIDAVEDATG